MSWTEPGCFCRGTSTPGVDGCEVDEPSDFGIDRLRTAIADDAASTHGLIDAIERDVQRLQQHRGAVTEPPEHSTDTSYTSPRALPAPSITDNLWEHVMNKEETIA